MLVSVRCSLCVTVPRRGRVGAMCRVFPDRGLQYNQAFIDIAEWEKRDEVRMIGRMRIKAEKNEVRVNVYMYVFPVEWETDACSECERGFGTSRGMGEERLQQLLLLHFHLVPAS